MSLDGFATAAGADLDHGLGVGGEPLHAGAVSARTAADTEIIEASVARTGAILTGRRTFDLGDGPNGWQGDLGHGAERGRHTPPPTFLVTHAEPDDVRLRGRFTFVTGGLHDALAQAADAARGKDVVVLGGGNLAHGYLDTGLVDVLVIHPASIVPGDGTPLFPPRSSTTHRLELLGPVSTPAAEHLTYRVLNQTPTHPTRVCQTNGVTGSCWGVTSGRRTGVRRR